MTIRAVAWDVDGVLVDSEPLHLQALLAAGRRWNVDLSDLSDQTFCGVHMHDVWTALAGRFPVGLKRADWLSAIEEHYAAEAASLTPQVGAVEAVHSFAACGLSQVCVSNSSRRIVDANLHTLGISGDIAFSISFDDVVHGKPDSEPYRLACKRLGLAPGAVLAVEDSLTGLRSARAAGLRTVGWGPHLTHAAEADVLASRFDDLVGRVVAKCDQRLERKDNRG